MGKELNYKKIVPFCFFLSSYIPLFLVLVSRNIYTHKDFLHFGGFHTESLKCFFQEYWVSLLLIILAFIGLLGTIKTIKFLKEDSENGNIVTIRQCKNQTSDSLAYFATYLFPLFFQSLSNWTDGFAIFIFLLVVLLIYVNTTMMTINPLLHLFGYKTYEVSFTDELKRERFGCVLTKSALDEDYQLILYKFGHQTYFGVIK